MTLLHIEATNNTPLIDFDPKNSVLEIKGDSYPENSFSFYTPVLEWIEEFLQSRPQHLTCNFELIYFNSSTSKVLYDLLDMLNDAKDEIDVHVYWYYNKMNYSALEAGEEFQEDYEELDFQLSAVGDE